MTQLWSFVGLLAIHWVGDFFLQSHWMSLNKSKRNDVLAMHVGVYTATLFAGSGLIFVLLGGFRYYSYEVPAFALINGILHFGTDYVTSRITSYLWRKERIHDFFVMIGVDQFIHQVTLAVTMWWILT